MVIFTLVFGVFFLNTKYSRHHFVGIIFILIGIIIYSLSEIFKLNNNKSDDKNSEEPEHKTKKIIIFILLATQECCEKFCMEYIYISPYLLISIEGICGTIITSLLFIPLSYFQCSDYESYEICNTGSSVKIEDVLSTIGYISRHREIILLLFIVFLCYMFLMCLETD